MPLEMWRLTLGFNQLSISKEGHSFTMQVWSSDKRALELKVREYTLELKSTLKSRWVILRVNGGAG